MQPVMKQPNTTQTPNVLFDYWLSILSEAELKVILVIIRQTFGYVKQAGKSERKEMDWISRGFLMSKAGLSPYAISKAIAMLIKYGLVEAFDRKGGSLPETVDRQRCNGRIFYRPNIKRPPATLFDAVQKPVRKVWTNRGEVARGGKNLASKNLATTK